MFTSLSLKENESSESKPRLHHLEARESRDILRSLTEHIPGAGASWAECRAFSGDPRAGNVLLKLVK